MDFPPLSSIVAASHLHGLADSQVKEHVRSRSQAKTSSRTQELNRGERQGQEEVAEEEVLYVLCTALKTNARMNQLVDKQASVERKLDVHLTLMNIDRKFACYSVIVEDRVMNSEEVTTTLRSNEMLVQMLPNELKINQNVINMIERMRSYPDENMDSAQLLIHLYKNFSSSSGERYETPDEEVESVLDAAWTRGMTPQNRREDFGDLIRTWRQLKSSSLQTDGLLCTDIPHIHKKYTKNRNTIKITIRDIFTVDNSVDCFMSFVEALADSPRVGRLAIGHKSVALNYESRGTTQSGVIFDEPYSDAGLDGTDQIVGVADTGLYDLSCFFYDDSSTTGDVTTRVQLTSNSFTVAGLTVESNRRKVIQYNYNVYTDAIDDQGGHGTHVVGSIIGSCPTNPQMNGMAPASKVSFFDIGLTDAGYLVTSPSDYAIYNSAYLAGARVHSNSWGANCGYAELPCDLPYDDSCEMADQFMWDHPDMLILFAAGNEGDSGKRSIGSPALSKNPVTVGATITRAFSSDEFISESAMTSFSSIGPTQDDRYGIDIAAPGDYIMSAFSGHPNDLTAAINSGTGNMQARSVLPMSGTSMATPIAAGNALLIRQFFMDSNFWENICNSVDSQCGALTSPSAALIKSVMLNSGSAVKRYGIPYDGGTEGTQLLGSPPDIFQGYGQVTLKNVFTLDDGTGMDANKALFIHDDLSLSSGSIMKFVVTISSDNVNKELDLKVTIAWTDKPYDVAANGASILLNDIDLMLETPNGNSYWGNRQPDGDDKNTVEQIHIATTTEVGDYTIYVKANTLVTSTQKVALVATYPCDAYPNNKGNVYVTGPTSVFSLPSGLTTITAPPTAAPATTPPLPAASPTADPPTVVEYILNAPAEAKIGPNFEDTGLVFIGNVSAQGLLKSIIFDMSVPGYSLWSLYSIFSSILITAPNGQRAWFPGWYAEDYDTANIYKTSLWPYNSIDYQYLPWTKHLSGAEMEVAAPGDWQVHLAFAYGWRTDDYYDLVSSDLIGSLSLKIDTAGTTPAPSTPPTIQPTSPTPLPTINPTAKPFTLPTLAPVVTAYPTVEVNVVSFSMTGLSRDEILSDVVLQFALRTSIGRALQVDIVYIGEIQVEEIYGTSGSSSSSSSVSSLRWKLKSSIVDISAIVSSDFTMQVTTANIIQYEFRTELQSAQPWRDTSGYNISNVNNEEQINTDNDKYVNYTFGWYVLYTFCGIVFIGILICCRSAKCDTQSLCRCKRKRTHHDAESAFGRVVPVPPAAISQVPREEPQASENRASRSSSFSLSMASIVDHGTNEMATPPICTGRVVEAVDRTHEDHPEDPPPLSDL